MVGALKTFAALNNDQVFCRSELIHRCKHGILQYTVVRPCTTVISLWVQPIKKAPVIRLFLTAKYEHFSQDMRSNECLRRGQIQGKRCLSVHDCHQQFVPVHRYVPPRFLLSRSPRSPAADETDREVSVHQSSRLLFFLVSLSVQYSQPFFAVCFPFILSSLFIYLLVFSF